MPRNRPAVTAEKRFARLAEAAAVLKSFAPDNNLFIKGNRLFVSHIWPDGTHYTERPAILRSIGDSLEYYRDLGMGSTRGMAIGQLVRWVRGWTRVPMASWEYWASPTIRLGSELTLELLRNSSYPDPEKTKCVLCGEQPRGVDWADFDDRIGPCCCLERCRDRAKGVAS